MYEAFLGTWTLEPASCVYEQSEAPAESTHRIFVEGKKLIITMHWTLADATKHQMQFSGIPNGKPMPFAGGELADALAIHAISKRELTTSAYWKGKEIMLSQRQLDDTGSAMRVTQIVRFQGGTHAANVGVYRKNSQA